MEGGERRGEKKELRSIMDMYQLDRMSMIISTNENTRKEWITQSSVNTKQGTNRTEDKISPDHLTRSIESL